jgi:hypothetical protein
MAPFLQLHSALSAMLRHVEGKSERMKPQIRASNEEKEMTMENRYAGKEDRKRGKAFLPFGESRRRWDMYGRD